MIHQLTLDMSAEDECGDRRWLVLRALTWCERNTDERGNCRYGWRYAKGDEVVYVTSLPPRTYCGAQFIDWPRCQRREGTETGEVVVGDIEQALRLIERRGFTAEILAAVRSERDVVRRRSEPRAASAEQPSTVCEVWLAALAA